MDPPQRVTAEQGQLITVRLAERAASGVVWGTPAIDKRGLTLEHSRVIDEKRDSADQHREFVFRAVLPGSYCVSTVLRQAGFEFGMRTFQLLVEVTASTD